MPRVQVLAAKPAALRELGKINCFSGSRAGAGLSPWPNNHQCLLYRPYLWGHHPPRSPCQCLEASGSRTPQEPSRVSHLPSHPPDASITFCVCPRLARAEQSQYAHVANRVPQTGTLGPSSFLHHTASKHLPILQPALLPAEDPSARRSAKKGIAARSQVWLKRHLGSNSHGFHLGISLTKHQRSPDPATGLTASPRPLPSFVPADTTREHPALTLCLQQTRKPLPRDNKKWLSTPVIREEHHFKQYGSTEGNLFRDKPLQMHFRKSF